MTQPQTMDTITFLIVRMQEPRPNAEERRKQAKGQKQERLGIFFGWPITTEHLNSLISCANASLSLGDLSTKNFKVHIYRNPETARSIDGCRVLRNAGQYSDSQDAYLQFVNGRVRLTIRLNGQVYRSESFGVPDLLIAQGEHVNILRQRTRQSQRSARQALNSAPVITEAHTDLHAEVTTPEQVLHLDADPALTHA